MAFYFQSASPTSPAARDMWINTDTGAWSFRDNANTLWLTIGNINRQYGGNVPIHGATMSGAITGTTGVQGVVDGAFTGTMTLNGHPVALKTYVDQQVSSAFLTSTVVTLPNYLFNSIFATKSTQWATDSQSTAVYTLGFDLPSYYSEDGSAIPSSKAQSRIALGGPIKWYGDYPEGQGSISWTWDITEDSSSTAEFRFKAWGTGATTQGGANSHGMKMMGIVASRRS